MTNPFIALYPEVNNGSYPVKCETDRPLKIRVITKKRFKGYVAVKYRQIVPEKTVWKLKQMQRGAEEGRWFSEINFRKPGMYEYTAVAAKVTGKVTTGTAPLNRNSTIGYAHNLRVIVEPPSARFASWYEMFHRSQGKIPGRSATFKDMEKRLPEIAKLGFDVIYLPPIHPIGKTNRKGRNNSLTAGPDSPGSPWAIGNENGGHKSVNPELGTLDDFRWFVNKAKNFGINIAIDIALNCSPDHPYVKEHPGWFYHRKDGTIAYAENPPKKYEDIYPLNFYPEDYKAMWAEMRSIFAFWIKHGVKIFRVDNPHTKPTEFWKWVINDIKREYPDTIFLSEAFTYFEKLEELAKVGFSQTYTYFIWRNTKNEFIEYFTKLSSGITKEFLRPNLFTNTPDICPKIVQQAGRPAFKMRAALAATLSSLWGIYNGYELCENSAFPGTETYRDSEKYEYKTWDWDRTGNIKDYISHLNEIRRGNKALQYFDNLEFCDSTDDNMLCYLKLSPDNSNQILIVANLDPWNVHFTRVTVPVERLGIASGEHYQTEELITGNKYLWRGRDNYVRINPQIEPVYIFRINRVAQPLRGRAGADLSTQRRSNLATDKEQKMIALARKHWKSFLRLRKLVVEKNDVFARRELAMHYNKQMEPLLYTGPDYDATYRTEMDALAHEAGFLSPENAYFTTPGH